MTVPSKDLSSYFADARTFDGERADAAKRSKTLAWRLATASMVMTVAALIAVVCMLPLRTVEVHVFRVDNATGMVDLVQPLKGSQSYNEAVVKYFAAKYVRAREGYLGVDAKQAFRAVTLMSVAAEQERYAEWSSHRNPKSFVAVLGRDGRADVQVRTISFPQKDLALVRFTRVVHQDGRQVPSHFQATIGFEFVAGAEMAESDREVNPLGFVVKQYRVDQEAM